MPAVFSVIPDPTTATLYKTQKLFLTVKVTSTTPITGTHRITLVGPTALSDSTNGFAYDTSALGVDYSMPQPLVMNSDNLTGTATFILDVKMTATTSNLQFRLFSDTGLGAPPAQISYGNLGEQLSPVVLGPSKLWMPIPPTDNLTPVTGPDYTNTYSVTMLDPSTSAGVPYCVIDWHEANIADVYRNLFAREMNTYLTTNGTVIVDDNHTYWPNGPLARDPNGVTTFIRTITGSDGVATLYLVAKNSTGPLVAGVDIWAEWIGGYPTPYFTVANVDLTTITLSNIAPVPGDIDAATGNVNYGATQAPTVPVNLNLSNMPNIGDLIYTFINGHLGSIISWSPADYSIAYQSTFPKKFGYSGTDAADRNTLQFLWVDLASYSFNVSAAGLFYGEGNPNVPPTGGSL